MRKTGRTTARRPHLYGWVVVADGGYRPCSGAYVTFAKRFSCEIASNRSRACTVIIQPGYSGGNALVVFKRVIWSPASLSSGAA